VVVETTTLTPRDGIVERYWAEMYGLPGSDSTAVEDLQRRGRVALSLSSIGSIMAARLHWPIQIVPAATFASFPKSGPPMPRERSAAGWFWDGFYRMFPNAMGDVVFSAVGYDKHRTRAVLMVNHGCGPMCGQGYVVILRRDRTGWHIVTLVITDQS
jgi:hypothetical protein